MHYNLVNKIIMDCEISDINPDHNEGNEDSLQNRLIPDQAYWLIIMDETRIVENKS